MSAPAGRDTEYRRVRCRNGRGGQANRAPTTCEDEPADDPGREDNHDNRLRPDPGHPWTLRNSPEHEFLPQLDTGVFAHFAADEIDEPKHIAGRGPRVGDHIIRIASLSSAAPTRCRARPACSISAAA